MAFATPNEVMTHVPCSGDTPRSPAIAGIDTLAIDVSSTFMKVASDSAIVPSRSAPSLSDAGAAAAARGAAAGSTLVFVMTRWLSTSRLHHVAADGDRGLHRAGFSQAMRGSTGTRAIAARQPRRARLIRRDDRFHAFVRELVLRMED